MLLTYVADTQMVQMILKGDGKDFLNLKICMISVLTAEKIQRMFKNASERKGSVVDVMWFRYLLKLASDLLQ